MSLGLNSQISSPAFLLTLATFSTKMCNIVTSAIKFKNQFFMKTGKVGLCSPFRKRYCLFRLSDVTLLM